MYTFTRSHGNGMHQVEACVAICGNDISVCIGGGTKQHIGAAALGIARPSLENPAKRSASASVFCVTGHKEDDLARSAALQLSGKFATNVLVSVGLHIDDATIDDIKILQKNFTEILLAVEETLQLHLSHRSKN